MKKPVVVILLIVILLAALGGGWWWYQSSRQQPLTPDLAVGGIAHQRCRAGLIGDSLQWRFAPSGNKHPVARGAHQPRAGGANSGSATGYHHDSRHPHSPVMGFPITLKSASGPGYRPEER